MRAGGRRAGIGIQPLFIIRKILIIGSDPEKSKEYHSYTAMKFGCLGLLLRLEIKPAGLAKIESAGRLLGPNESKIQCSLSRINHRFGSSFIESLIGKKIVMLMRMSIYEPVLFSLDNKLVIVTGAA